MTSLKRTLMLVTTAFLLLPLPGHLVRCQYFGTGSSRLEDVNALDQEVAAEYKEMIEDKEHIQDEMDHIFSKQQIRLMTSEEMAFNWFTGHDSDGDKSLDGLELYKAISHSRGHKSGNHNHEHHHQPPLVAAPATKPHHPLPPGVPPPPPPFHPAAASNPTAAAQPTGDDTLGTEDRGAIGFVDQLLQQFDIDNDGRLDYGEFVKSFEEAGEKLGIQKI